MAVSVEREINKPLSGSFGDFDISIGIGIQILTQPFTQYKSPLQLSIT